MESGYWRQVLTGLLISAISRQAFQDNPKTFAAPPYPFLRAHSFLPLHIGGKTSSTDLQKRFS